MFFFFLVMSRLLEESQNRVRCRIIILVPAILQFDAELLLFPLAGMCRGGVCSGGVSMTGVKGRGVCNKFQDQSILEK